MKASSKLIFHKKYFQISELDVSCNWGMGVKGVGCIGSIVKNITVDKLSMSDCSLKHEELEAFNKECSGEKVRIQRLDVLQVV